MGALVFLPVVAMVVAMVFAGNHSFPSKLGVKKNFNNEERCFLSPIFQKGESERLLLPCCFYNPR